MIFVLAAGLFLAGLLLSSLFFPSFLLYALQYGWKRPFHAAEVWLRRARRRRHLPPHVAFIMDGNRRYAKSLGLSTASMGHELGVQKVRDVLEWCLSFREIKEITLWALSTDNLHRPPAELDKIWSLCKLHLTEIADSEVVQKNRVVLRIIGERALIPKDVIACIQHAEKKTLAYEPRYVLNIGIAYGGREEIVHMAREAFLQEAVDKAGVVEIGKEGVRRMANVTQEDFCKFSYTRTECDLIVRTGGEVRLSGFMMWQSKHAELVFDNVLWPAFGLVHLLRALDEFHHRHRRFGR